jgi:hypothetical protein
LPNIHGAAHPNEKAETVEGWDGFTGVEFHGRPLMTLLRPKFPKYSRARELEVLEEYPFWSVVAFSLSRIAQTAGMPQHSSSQEEVGIREIFTV